MPGEVPNTKTPKNENYLSRLRETIVKSGFPMELEIDNSLRSKSWRTFPSYYFADPEEKKIREIDNLALFPEKASQDRSLDPIGFSPLLLVESKKLGEGYSAVIFRRHQDAVTTRDFEGQIFDFPVLIEQRTPSYRVLDEFNFQWLMSFTGLHYGSFQNRIGTLTTMKPSKEVNDLSKEKGRDDFLYGGIMQLIKAQTDYAVRAIARDKEIVHPYYPFFFSFLVLVVDGDVIEVELDRSEVNLEPVGHGIAITGYQPPYSDRVLNYLVDVVDRKSFPAYLETLQGDRANLVKALVKDKERLVKYFKRAKT